jgi:hypothetical protein
MSTLVVLIVLIQPPAQQPPASNSPRQQPSQKATKQEPPKPSFDFNNPERTAIFLAQWHKKLSIEFAKGERSGNMLDAETMQHQFDEEMREFIGHEVNWPLRIAGAANSTIFFGEDYFFKNSKTGLGIYAGTVGDRFKGGLGGLGRSGNGNEGSGIEPWMHKLKPGDFVMATAKIQRISSKQVWIGDPTITPMPMPKKK